MFESEKPRTHSYHAEATALKADLEQPLRQTITPQAAIALPETGGYHSQRLHTYRAGEVLTFGSAHTQVGGNEETKKPEHGWTTLATAVVENINILDVLTADRVVSQISTDHPKQGYVPTISFLGTRFENLRIAGHPVHLELNLNIFGQRSEGDVPYTKNHEFLACVDRQYKQLKDFDDLPADVAARYKEVSEDASGEKGLECSLVNKAEGAYPGQSFGHVIHVPNFGTIYLATVRLLQHEFEKNVPKKTTFELTMIEVDMGCIGSGKVGVASTRTNGGSKP